ncbi:MAG: HAMP domain-containing protein, partial [Pseudomonadota bacterium]
MNRRVFIPLRYKILISLLLGISIIVGAITFTMADLFHTDKTAYINDLILTNTIHTAQETQTLLQNYSERVKAIARVAYDTGIDHDQKTRLFVDFFNTFPEIIAITFYEDGEEKTSVFDELALEEAGLTKSELDAHRVEDPARSPETGVRDMVVRNSTFIPSLPIMTLTTGANIPGMEVGLVISAVISTDRLYSLITRSELFEAFILEPDGRYLVHEDLQNVLGRKSARWRPESGVLSMESNLAATFDYDIDGVEMIGGFTRVEAGDLIVGTQIPYSSAYLGVRDLFDRLQFTAFIILLLATGASFFWSYRITRPLEQLSKATREVGRGDFDIKVKATSHDEIGSLTDSVNQMAMELKEREKALGEAQAALVQSEKMSAFGQLSAGIAHEVKNPLAGILGYAQMSLKKMENDSPVYKNMKIIEKETRRCNSIIENLMKFARQD